MFGADLCAALGDVAVADAVVVLDVGEAFFDVERVHIECCGVDEVAGAGELGVLVVLAKDVANVLTEEALDALTELLNSLDVFLTDAPRAVGGVGLSWFEGFDRFLDGEVPGDVGDQITDRWECLQGFDDDLGTEIEIAQSSHAHESWHAVDFGGARSALTGFAIPAAGKVGRALGLDLMHGVEYDHYDEGHLWVETLKNQVLHKVRISDWSVQHTIPLPYGRAHGAVRVEDGIWVVHTSERVIVKLNLEDGSELDRINVPTPYPEPHGLSIFGNGFLYCDAASGWIAKIS